MKRICILCGEPAEVENFCCECWTKTHDLFEIESFELKICKDCGSYYDKGEWKPSERIEDLVSRLVKERIKTENKIKKLEISLKRIGTNYIVKIHAEGYVKPCRILKREDKKIMVRIKRTLCDLCKKKRANAYEAVLTFKVEIPEEVMNIVSNYVSKIEEGDKSTKLYIVDKKVASKAVKVLKSMGFNVKVSYKLVGMKKGRKIYRNYYHIGVRNGRGR